MHHTVLSNLHISVISYLIFETAGKYNQDPSFTEEETEAQ